MKRKKAKAKPAPAKRAGKKIVKPKLRGAARAPAKKAKTALPKPPQPDALDALMTASAQQLRLPLEPAWRAGVKFNLNLIFRIASTIDEFPLPDDAEPGPVFHA